MVRQYTPAEYARIKQIALNVAEWFDEKYGEDEASGQDATTLALLNSLLDEDDRVGVDSEGTNEVVAQIVNAIEQAE